MSKVFFLWFDHKHGAKKNATSWRVETETFAPWCSATEPQRLQGELSHYFILLGSTMSMNLQLGSKMRKDVFRLQCYESGRRNKIGPNIFLTILNHTKLSTLLLLADCGMCVTYKLSNSLTKLTVSQVIERLSVAWTEDLSHELLNFYFLTLRASLELRMISI